MMRSHTRFSAAARIGLRCGRWALAAYLVVLLLLLLLENTLLYPAPRYPVGDWAAAELVREEAWFTSADGTKLHGWLFAHDEPRAVILYAHGNGDCVAYLGPFLAAMRDKLRVSIFAFDYRGYGRSEGAPFEKGILDDARAAQAWLAERTSKRPDELVLMGRSLGGGVAVDLAALDGARGLVLQNTFTSLPDAAARLYPWAPVRWLMKNRYDSLAKIHAYEGPIFASHGTLDDLVPMDLGRRLFDAAPSPRKTFFVIEGAGHNTPEPREYYEALDRWLEDL